jgi:tetratricopeptide (TPR) repeat protein
MKENSLTKFINIFQFRENLKRTKEIEKLIKKTLIIRYKVLRGNIYLERNEKEKALALYQEVLKKNPDNGLARLSMAEYYDKNGEQDKSVQEMDIALNSKNTDVEAKLSILDKYISQIRKTENWQDKISSLFESLIKIHPNVEDIYNYYANYLISIQKLDEAVKIYDIVLELNPQNLNAWFIVLDVKIQQNKIDEIIPISERAINNLPDYPQWYFYQGVAYQQLKQNEKHKYLTKRSKIN